MKQTTKKAHAVRLRLYLFTGW